MWPFKKKQKIEREVSVPDSSGPDAITVRPAEPVFTKLVVHEGTDELNLDDAVLKVWLPLACKTALAEVCQHRRESQAAWLREFLAVHVFGEHELMRMRRLRMGLYDRPEDRRCCSVSLAFHQRRPYEVLPGVGREIHLLELHLPSRLKNELATLGQQTGMELSAYTRMLLVSRLLGHRAWHRHPEGAPLEITTAEAWERGERPSEQWVHGDGISVPECNVSVMR